MKKFFVIFLTLGLVQCFPVLALADHPGGDRDKKERKEGRESRSEERETVKKDEPSKVTDENKGDHRVKGRDKVEQPSLSHDRSKFSREDGDVTRPQGESQGNFRKARKQRGGDPQSVEGDRFKASQLTHDGTQGTDQNDNATGGRGDLRGNRDHKVQPYQWKDKDEEKQGKERGWNKPVRLTDDVRKKGVRELPQYISEHKNYISTKRDRSIIQHPDRDWEGRGIKARMVERGNDRVVVNQMRKVTINNTFINQINIYNNNETQTNHYYWHYDNGVRYCHYRDPWGYRWFGWYVGSYYFWTRYHAGHFWWYDNSYDRWCYWNNGYWWWQDPYRVNTVYMYDNTRYIQAVSNDQLEVGLPEDATSSDSDQERADVKVYRSKDETRMVKVIGKDQEAFLYDTGSDHPFKPVYLGEKIKEVRFSNPSSKRSLQVMLVYRDDSFELFDSKGRSLGDREF